MLAENDGPTKVKKMNCFVSFNKLQAAKYDCVKTIIVLRHMNTIWVQDMPKYMTSKVTLKLKKINQT